VRNSMGHPSTERGTISTRKFGHAMSLRVLD
jgi:hypothetical protein